MTHIVDPSEGFNVLVTENGEIVYSGMSAEQVRLVAASMDAAVLNDPTAKFIAVQLHDDDTPLAAVGPFADPVAAMVAAEESAKNIAEIDNTVGDGTMSPTRYIVMQLNDHPLAVKCDTGG